MVQDAEEVRQWRASVWRQAQRSRWEACAEAVERYRCNAELLAALFQPPRSPGRAAAASLVQGEHGGAVAGTEQGDRQELGMQWL